jgi:hypothetical protein
MNKSFAGMLSDKMQGNGRWPKPAIKKSIAGGIYTESFVLICDWYEEHGTKPVPRPGMGYADDLVAQFQQFFEPGLVRLETEYANPNGSNVEISLQLRALPLVAGFLAGFDQEALSRIAIEHDVDPLEFTYSFRSQPEPFRSADGDKVSSLQVYAGCFKALEALGVERILDAYERCEDDCEMFGFGLSLMKSEQLWPSTLLLQYQNAQQGKSALPEAELRTSIHDCLFYVMDSECLPMDDSGIRYDWFLERMGFLLPGVNQKSLGQFTHWEDLVFLSQEYPERRSFAGILDYCIHGAPDAMKPAIYTGLKSMMADSSGFIVGSAELLEYMADKFKDTWLDGLTLDPAVQINIVGSTKADLDDYIQQFPKVFQGMIGDLSDSTSSVLRKLAELPAEKFSLADFNALPYLIQHANTVDTSIPLELCTLNLLKGHDWLMGNEELTFDDKDEIKRISRAGCMAVMEVLAKSSRIDYGVFKALKSDHVAMLVESGLDIRKLPKMNNRDRGRALEMEMGL